MVGILFWVEDCKHAGNPEKKGRGSGGSGREREREGVVGAAVLNNRHPTGLARNGFRGRGTARVEQQDQIMGVNISRGGMTAFLVFLLFAAIGHGRHSFEKNVPYSSRDLVNYPDIFLIGAMKAGTTSFFKLLLSRGSTRENASFSKEICDYGEKEKHFFVGHSYKTDYEAAKNKYISEFSGCNISSQKTIDATPGMTSGSVALTVQRMKQHYTKATLAKKKFIYILREPVARLYSEYQMAVRLCLDLDADLPGAKSYKNNDTLQATSQDETTWRLHRHQRSCSRVMTDKMAKHFHNILNEQGGHNAAITVDNILSFHDWVLTDSGMQETLRGNYQYIISEYCKQFITRDKLFLINFDMLIRNATPILNGLQQFLGLKTPWPPNPKMPYASKAPVHSVIDCTTVQMLNDYYGGERQLIDYLKISPKPPEEPPFGRFQSPFQKCSRLNLTRDDYDERTWKFTQLMLREEEKEKEEEWGEVEKEVEELSKGTAIKI